MVGSDPGFDADAAVAANVAEDKPTADPKAAFAGQDFEYSDDANDVDEPIAEAGPKAVEFAALLVVVDCEE